MHPFPQYRSRALSPFRPQNPNSAPTSHLLKAFLISCKLFRKEVITFRLLQVSSALCSPFSRFRSIPFSLAFTINPQTLGELTLAPSPQWLLQPGHSHKGRVDRYLRQRSRDAVGERQENEGRQFSGCNAPLPDPAPVPAEAPLVTITFKIYGLCCHGEGTDTTVGMGVSAPKKTTP